MYIEKIEKKALSSKSRLQNGDRKILAEIHDPSKYASGGIDQVLLGILFSSKLLRIAVVKLPRSELPRFHLIEILMLERA